MDMARSSSSVMYVSPGWPSETLANGIISYISAMADELRRNHHRVCILSHQLVGSVPDYVYDLSLVDSARSLPRRLLRRLHLIGDLTPRYRLWRMLSATLPRLVAEHDPQILELEDSFGLASLARRKISIPIVVRLHGPWFLNGPLSVASFEFADRERVRDEGEAIRLADGITAPSHDVLAQVRAFYGLELTGAKVIPNPMPTVPAERRWRLEACDPGLILFVGRFDRHKGGDLMIDAFSEVAREFPGTRLCFIGPDRGIPGDDGKWCGLADYLRKRIPRAQESGRVEWLGQQPSSVVAKFRRLSRVTVVCSRYETFGLTATEAMAHGCPLVVTRAGTLPEIVRDGVDGLLCRPSDASDLARAIVRLLADPYLSAHLGGRAVEECERRYHPSIILNDTLKFYNQFI